MADDQQAPHAAEEWRISRSGYSIRTGWGDDKVMLAVCPGSSTTSHPDTATFKRWMDFAEQVVDAHNARLRELPVPQSTVAPSGREERSPDGMRELTQAEGAMLDRALLRSVTRKPTQQTPLPAERVTEC